MKNSFRSFIFLMAALFAGLVCSSYAETVHNQTYNKAMTENLFMTVHADHTDNGIIGSGTEFPIVSGDSMLRVYLSVTVRDQDGVIISTSSIGYEMRGGYVEELGRDEGMGTHVEGYYVDPRTSNMTAEVYLSLEYSPPSTVENYTVEVTIEKFTDSLDTHHVTYEIY